MSNTQKISAFFSTNYPLNKEGLEEAIAAFELKIIPKNKILLQEGTQENTLRFLNKGIIREFYVGSQKETNINFFTSPQFVTDFSSFIHGSKTKKNQESLSELEILVIGKEKFTYFLEKHSCGKSFIETAFLKILKHQELLEYNRITKAPEELYQILQSQKTDWLQKIPQYHIASYLGITPETLSRIRKRIS
jgi:CRP-like cAMP-binding protein